MSDVGFVARVAEIPRVGVSLAGLERFVAAVASYAPGGSLAGLSTDAVNRLAMLHLTGARRCAYTDLLADDSTLVGPPDVFLSHAWAMLFDSLVACVRAADAALRSPAHPRHVPGSTPYFWVDLVVNDQFSAPARPFAWWQTVFRENVQRIGHTVVALEWEDPKPPRETARERRPSASGRSRSSWPGAPAARRRPRSRCRPRPSRR